MATLAARALPRDAEVGAAARDVGAYVRTAPDGLRALDLMVEGVHCGGCVRRIERALETEGDVVSARVNLTTRRLSLRWQGTEARGGELAGRVSALGYSVVPFDPDRLVALDNKSERELLLCLAVAGFAASNIMLLAVSIWAGDAYGMGAGTRTFLYWFEALVALPAIAFAGRPFFRSAMGALRAGRTNMDVPISLGVLLTTAMSLYQTLHAGVHAYFDSAVTLLFFLLIGRYLDLRARGQARSAAERLLALSASAVTVVAADGSLRSSLPGQVERGQEVLVTAGERIGVDGTVVDGCSEIDTSLITGETVPQAVAPGSNTFAGTLNIAAALRIRVTSAGEGTLLADIVRLMETAEQRRGRFVAIADRIARFYAPVVHLLALTTVLGWLILAAVPWPTALLHAVAVLIVTCPCALGLAVPAVQVLASGRLMRQGTLLKSATALERFAEVDTIVFDKTGTLTEGRLELIAGGEDRTTLEAAAGLALASRHPVARALARAAPAARLRRGVEEIPGCGLRLATPEGEWRLGRGGWAGLCSLNNDSGPELWFSRPGHVAVRFLFADRPREDASSVIAALHARGLAVELLSGDREPVVREVAAAIGISEWRAGCTPAAKVARLEELARAGRRTLMVGDGLNDAPALAAAFVSLSPATAADISQTAADAVFQGRRLAPVLEVLDVARRAERLVRQNLGLSFAYNLLAVPAAMAGLVTPLIAAIAMSSSSITVVLNSLRLRRH